MTQATKKKGPRAPKKITQTYLENAALYYLQRYATSAENLRRVLKRKVKRAELYHGEVPEHSQDWIDNLIKRYVKSNLVNDEVYARSRSDTLRRKGASQRAIQAKLSEKGVSAEIIGKALLRVDSDKEDAELEAACAYVRRRRLGQDIDRYDKDLAALARAGFCYDTARKALELSSSSLCKQE